MTLTVGVLALLEAKPGKEGEVAELLATAQGLVENEPGTRVWYAFRAGDTTFGIFDAFEDEEARQAHLDGEIPIALAKVGPDLLAQDPDIRPVDVVAFKPV